jgi:hypothetical protein
MIKVTTFGFDKFQAFANGIAREFENITKEPLLQVGLRGEAIAKLHLQNQDLGWQPLSDRYLKLKMKQRKGKRRLSEKTLIATSSYFQSITSKVLGRRVLIGVMRGVRNDDGQEIANIAKIHEYGSTARNIPARPLWQPTLEELKNYVTTARPFLRSARILLKRRYGI